MARRVPGALRPGRPDRAAAPVPSRVIWIALALMTVDAALVANDVARHVAAGPDGTVALIWRVDWDFGVPERWNCAKWMIAAAAFAFAALNGRAGFAYLAAIPALLFADDWLRLHEKVAGRVVQIAPALEETSAIAVLDVASFAALGVLVGVLLWLAWRRGGTAARASVPRIVVLILCLGAFGVGVDAVHTAIFGWTASFSWGSYALEMAENAGELLGTTAILALALGEAVRAGRSG